MEKRPWGWFRVIEEGKGYVVKELFVEEGKRTSLQLHRHRDEVWVVVEGRGYARVGDERFSLIPGSVVKVRRGTPHRLEGGSGGMRIVEVWLGEVLDENDIVRLEDDYGRV